jgi:hypothetical protein
VLTTKCLDEQNKDEDGKSEQERLKEKASTQARPSEKFPPSRQRDEIAHNVGCASGVGGGGGDGCGYNGPCVSLLAWL